MFQLLAGRNPASPVVYDDVQWDAGSVPAEYVLSQAGKAYARSGVNAGNNSLTNYLYADKPLTLANLGGGLAYYWEIDLTGSVVFDGYHGVQDAATAAANFDQSVDPLADGAAYRGDGGVWQDGAQVSGFASYGDGDTIMLAFDPLDGALWTGVNGTWDREPWRDAPAALSPLAASHVVTGQARAAIDAGVLKSAPAEFTYPIPAGLIALGDTNLNPVMRPHYWEFPSTSSTVHSVPFARSPTFISSNSLWDNRNALTVRPIGGASGAGVPTAGYYFELYVSPVFGSQTDEVSAGFLPSTQWGVNVVPETLQWRADGRLYFDGVQTFPSPSAWANNSETGTRLMFCFNPHTGSLWLGQNGVWEDDPAVASPTYSYGVGLTLQWKVCVHHRGDGIPFIDKGATIYTLPHEFEYEMPSNAIPLSRVV
jgi:hypothetical protein